MRRKFSSHISPIDYNFAGSRDEMFYRVDAKLKALYCEILFIRDWEGDLSIELPSRIC